MRNRSSRTFGLLLIAVGGNGWGTEFQVSGDVGVGRSDNIERSSDAERSATFRSLGLQFFAFEQTRRMNIDAVGDLSFLDYSGNTYGSEVTGNAIARLSIVLVKERLAWVVEDSFGQVRQDQFDVASPANRENVNYFSAGPNLSFRLGSATSLLLQGRYALVDFEKTEASSERISYLGAAERVLSGEARLSLKVSNEEIDPRGSSPTPSYDRGAAYLSYAVTGSRSSFSIDAGANRVHGDVQTQSGLMLRMELDRNIGARSTISLGAGRELTDSGNSLGVQEADQLALPSSGTYALNQEAMPYTSTFVDVGWEIKGRLTGITFSARRAEEDYSSGSGGDRHLWQVGVGANRQLGPRTSLSAGVRYNSSDYDTQPGDNHDLGYNAGLQWRIGRQFGLELSGEHYRFHSSLDTGKAVETRYWLRLRYGSDSL